MRSPATRISWQDRCAPRETPAPRARHRNGVILHGKGSPDVHETHGGVSPRECSKSPGAQKRDVVHHVGDTAIASSMSSGVFAYRPTPVAQSRRTPAGNTRRRSSASNGREPDESSPPHNDIAPSSMRRRALRHGLSGPDNRHHRKTGPRNSHDAMTTGGEREQYFPQRRTGTCGRRRRRRMGSDTPRRLLAALSLIVILAVQASCAGRGCRRAGLLSLGGGGTAPTRIRGAVRARP